jgi:hypothetical protein
MRAFLACSLPVCVMLPLFTLLPLEFSDGVSPKYDVSPAAEENREISPSLSDKTKCHGLRYSLDGAKSIGLLFD